MINPSYLARSLKVFIESKSYFAGYTVLTRLPSAKTVVDNTVHVYLAPIVAYGASQSKFGSSNWGYTVFFDIYIPQNQTENYDDAEVGEVIQQLGDDLIGTEIRCNTYQNEVERSAGTFVKPTEIKIDQGAGPAARFEVELELSG